MAGELKKKLLSLMQNEIGKRAPASIGRIEEVDPDTKTISVTLQNPSGNGFITVKGASLPLQNGINGSSPPIGSRVILHAIQGNYTYCGVASVMSEFPNSYAAPFVPRNSTPSG
jgi:hypothetical protein